MTFDAIVLGLGPAGSTAAREMSRAGLSVLALEKKAMPRSKPCGGGLSLKVDKVLPPDFKEVVEETVSTMYFTCRGRDDLPVAAHKTVAYMVRRERFDHLLASLARAEGTAVLENAGATRIAETSDAIEVTTEKGCYRGRVLIGADGANGISGRWVRGPMRRTLAVSLESEVAGTLHDRLKGCAFIDIGCVPGGYGWIFPKKETLSVGIAGLTRQIRDPLRVFQRFIASQSLLNGVAVPRPIGYPIPIFSDPDRILSKGRILLTGDAAGLVDPFFGEGIYYAIRSGEIAARAVLRVLNGEVDDLSEYDRLIKEEMDPEFRAARTLSTLFYAFPLLCYKAVMRHPGALSLYYQVLRGEKTHAGFFSDLKERARTTVTDGLLKQAVGILG